MPILLISQDSIIQNISRWVFLKKNYVFGFVLLDVEVFKLGGKTLGDMDAHMVVVAEVVEVVLEICEEHGHVDATELPKLCSLFY